MALGQETAANLACDLAQKVSTSARRRNRMCRNVAGRTELYCSSFSGAMTQPVVVYIPQYIVVGAGQSPSAPSEYTQCPACCLLFAGGDGHGNEGCASTHPRNRDFEHTLSGQAKTLLPRADGCEISEADNAGERDHQALVVPTNLPRLFDPQYVDLTSVAAKLDDLSEEVTRSIITLGRVQSMIGNDLVLSHDLSVQRAHLSGTVDDVIDIIMQLEDLIPHPTCNFSRALEFAKIALQQLTAWVEDMDTLICASEQKFPKTGHIFDESS